MDFKWMCNGGKIFLVLKEIIKDNPTLTGEPFCGACGV